MRTQMCTIIKFILHDWVKEMFIKRINEGTEEEERTGEWKTGISGRREKNKRTDERIRGEREKWRMKEVKNGREKNERMKDRNKWKNGEEGTGEWENRGDREKTRMKDE